MSLRILCIGGTFFAPALAAMGHRLFMVNDTEQADMPGQHPFTVRHLIDRLAAKNFTPDVLLYCDDGNMPVLIDPENAPWPSVRYSIDTYCNPWHVPYSHGFDLTLAAQKDYVGLFVQEKLNAVWMPLFCPREPLPEGDFAARDIPVAFVGTLGHKNNPDREPFLKAFRARHPLFFLSGDYEPIFSRSCIVLNQTAISEVNFRCFEAISCGAALLMEQCGNGLSQLFVPGEEILPPYQRNNAAEAAAVAAKALSDPARLAEIAHAGYAALCQRHTSKARATELTRLLSELCQATPQVQRLQDADRRGCLVRGAYGMLASELQGPQWDEYRSFFEKACTGRL